MKKLFNLKLSSSSPKAFTLLELLIVIAVLGVLASAIITALNPVKKIGQAKDANIKSDIAQIATAMQTYYTNTGVTQTPYYPSAVVDLVPSELKSEPKTPDATSYTILKYPGTCTTAGKDCTSVAVYYAMKEPVTAGYVWCWESSTGIASEIAVGSCTAP